MIAIHEMADIITADLSAANFAQGIRVVRSWRPVRELKELSKTIITVVPVEQTSAMDTRNKTREEMGIDLIVQRHLGTSNPEALADEMDDLCNDCMGLFRLASIYLNGVRIGFVTMISRDVVFSHEQFDKFRIFTSHIRLTISTQGL